MTLTTMWIFANKHTMLIPFMQSVSTHYSWQTTTTVQNSILKKQKIPIFYVSREIFAMQNPLFVPSKTFFPNHTITYTIYLYCIYTYCIYHNILCIHIYIHAYTQSALHTYTDIYPNQIVYTISCILSYIPCTYRTYNAYMQIPYILSKHYLPLLNK